MCKNMFEEKICFFKVIIKYIVIDKLEKFKIDLVN